MLTSSWGVLRIFLALFRDGGGSLLATERETNDALGAELRRLKEHLHCYATVVSEPAADLAEAQARVEALSSVRKLQPRA